MQTDMGGYQPWQAGTSGSLKAYEPTWRDRLARVLMGDQKASPERARLVEGLTGSTGLGNSSIGVADFVPGLGQAFQAQEAVRSGDTDALAMAIIPGARGAKAATGAFDDTAKTGIRAYHGSPHDFDRFDMSKIGTGEGAQAYGHGLYFAESEGVAKSYREGLSKMAPAIDGNPVLEAYSDGSLPKIIADKIGISRSEGIGAANIMAESVRTGRPIGDILGEKIAREKSLYGSSTTEAWAEKLQGVAPNTSQGRMYEVRINADPGDFLDWDKPLSAQSEKVRGALASKFDAPDYWRGEDFARRYGDYERGGRDRLSQTLRDAGISGIKYLDQGSRAAGEGSRNYVVFRDDIIDIVKKYGIAAAASMYGMDQVQRVLIADQLQPAAQ